MARSFRDDRGQRALIENHWIYTGSGNGNVLDQARFGTTIGAKLLHHDALDRRVSATDRSHTSLAFVERTRDIGIYLTTFPTRDSESGVMDAKSTFISNSGHLILDRPLAAYLKTAFRGQLAAAFSEDIARLSNDQLITFLSTHPDKMGVIHVNANGPEKLVYLPDSLDVSIFATENSYHPTRSFYEQLNENSYEDGELMVDGHTHRALTPQRIGSDALLNALSQRFGAINGAAVLSLSDAQTITELKRASTAYGFKKPDGSQRTVDYAARELYVIDDSGNVVAHSVFNIMAMWDDQSRVQKFENAVRAALHAPTELAHRLAYHDVMHELTTTKGINEPLAPRDYL